MILTSRICVNKLDTEWNICEYIRHILQSREEIVQTTQFFQKSHEEVTVLTDTLIRNADLEDSIDIDI